jgi:hypothetical protein
MAHFDGSSSARASGGACRRCGSTEKGYRVLVIEKGKRFNKDDFPPEQLGRAALDVAARARASAASSRCPSSSTSPSCMGSASAAARWSTRTPCRCPRMTFFEKGSGRASRTGRRTSAATTRRRAPCWARRPTRASPEATRSSRRSPRRLGRGDHFEPTDVAVFFGKPNGGPDPYFGGKGPSPGRLQLLRRVHDRLPHRRQEHPRSELPLPRRAPRGAKGSSPRPRCSVRPGGARTGYGWRPRTRGRGAPADHHRGRR